MQATPLVRRVAQELGVELAAVTPTGPGGRITEEDVRAAAGGAATAEGRREPVRGVRRQIVEHLTRAHREIPAVTYVEECDFTDVDLKQLLPLVLRATAQSLQEFPELNARLEGDEIVYLDRYDLGVAVQTDQGLVVPVVRGCDSRSIDELRADVDELAQKARDGKLAQDDLRGSTFTVTSAGKLAGLFVTPLVNHPEVGNPRRPPHCASRRRARRRDRGAHDGQHQRHVRPPRCRRCACCCVHARGDRAASGVTRELSSPQAKRSAGARCCFEHRLDPRCARPAVEPRDGLAVDHEHERRHALDGELLDEVGALVDVDLDHA